MQKEVNSLYIHFPFCKHLCNYCDFYKKTYSTSQDVRKFEDWLVKSFDKHNNLLDKNNLKLNKLKTIYIGGGTPSLWGSEGAYFLKETLEKNNIKIERDAEFTLEVNPGGWTEDDITAWESIGVNRFSMGVQSLNNFFLKKLDRIHNVDDAFRTLKFFSDRKSNFSVDLMLGLPFSETDNRDVKKELDEILKFNPNHFSLYILTVKNHYNHFSDLPSEEWIEKEFLFVSDHLKKLGYNHYEVSNFGKKGLYSEHNLSYWRGESVAAIGPSATGFFSDTKLRYKWKMEQNDFVTEQLTSDEFELEKMYLGLRTSEGININEFYVNETDKWNVLINRWTSLNYLSSLNDPKKRLTLSSQGFLMLDSIMDDIFSNFK